MARTKGTLALSANFEPQIAAPLDARHVCSTMAELVLPATWTAKDGTVYAYQGMITSVWNDGANNGVYQLNGTDYTVAANWVKAGSGTIDADSVDTALTDFTEGTPADADYLTATGKKKFTLSTLWTWITGKGDSRYARTAEANTFTEAQTVTNGTSQTANASITATVAGSVGTAKVVTSVSGESTSLYTELGAYPSTNQTTIFGRKLGGAVGLWLTPLLNSFGFIGTTNKTSFIIGANAIKRIEIVPDGEINVVGEIVNDSGKGLSTNDYTTAEKNKLAAITGTNTGDQDLSGLASKTIQITSQTLLQANWTPVSGLYEYNLTNANITATKYVDIIPDNSTIVITEAAELLPTTVSSTGSVKLYAKSAPTGNIVVTINIYE
jgi:hypothetical protein